MSFHHPLVLWLLALPILWGFWQWVRRGHLVVLPLDHSNQPERRWLRILTKLACTLPAVLLAIAVLILAGPRKIAPPKDERVMSNILICVDLSKSMSEPFGQQGTRLDAAADAAMKFCTFREGDAFGLTIFGDEYIHWLPPTKDPSAITDSILNIRGVPSPFLGTRVAHALRGCRNSLVRIPEGDRAVILITDGESEDLSAGLDQLVAQELLNERIRVFTILVGGMGADRLNTIAAITGGKAFTVVDRASLDYVFREIDTMQKARFKRVFSDWVDNYTPLAATGLLVLGLAGLSLLGLRFTPW